MLLLVACNATSKQENISAQKKSAVVAKPPSSNSDTLKISGKAAVFFQPDSLQLRKISAVTDSNIFKGSMHEYAYQIRNAHLFLAAHWQDVKCIDTRTHRFVLFESKDKKVFLIDLDKEDPCGLIVFDNDKAPGFIDMTNNETQIPEYFLSKSLKEEK